MTDVTRIALAIQTLAAALAASGHASEAQAAIDRGIAAIKPRRQSLTYVPQMPSPHTWRRVPYRGQIK